MVASSLWLVSEFVPVDAPPAADWSAPRPTGLAPQLWAWARPTDATIASLGLPDGALVHGADSQLLGWVSTPGSDADLGEVWLRCARSFPATGLWPICDTVALRPGRAWDHVEVDGRPIWRDPYAVPSDVYDAANTADRQDYFDGPDGELDHRELLAEFGLAEADRRLPEASVMPADLLRRLVAPVPPRRLTLVACRRPSDAVLLLDFGVANDDATPGIFVGVLRSWETRFGVVPVMLDLAWTGFQVLAPPADGTQIDRLAAEVFSFATDTGVQGGFHRRYGDRAGDARSMVQSSQWLIWWD